MKRFLLALAVLFGGTGSLIHADYVKIILNLAAIQSGEPAQANPYGQPGYGQPGAGGMPPMGMPPASVPGGGYPMGPMGYQYPGGAGGDPAGGGVSVLPGGIGGQAGTGVPGEGMPGGMGMEGAFSEFDEPESSPFYVECVIELDAKKNDTKTGWHKGWTYDRTYNRILLKHQYGTTSLFMPAPNTVKATQVGSSVILTTKELQLIHVRMPTVGERYERERKQVAKDGNKPEDLVKLAEWALGHGLVDDVPKIIDDLAKADAKHPAVAAFKKVEADMKRDLSKDDGAAAWRQRLGDDYKSKQSKHYSLLYDTQADAAAEQRLNRLEGNFREFFYWFALRGKVLPMPARRMIAVLVESQEAFEHQHKDVFDDVPMTADGFYVPRDNIAVFSMKRLDEAYDGLYKLASPLWQTWNRQELVKGDASIWKKARDNPHKVGYAQILALVLHALEQESERTTVSHEGTRQLVRAIGLVPTNVRVPEWLDFGMASFFETPKGAFWPSMGAPSFNYLVRYKTWENTKKLDKPEEALRNVITNRYFRLAEEKRDHDEQDKAERKGHTMTWALSYYLANERRDGLLRYYQELTNMPRDLELDDEVLLGCFARAFDLVDVNKGNEIDNAKLTNLANAWYKYLRVTSLEATEVQNKAVLDYKKALVEKKPIDGLTPTPTPGTNIYTQPGLQGPAGRNRTPNPMGPPRTAN